MLHRLCVFCGSLHGNRPVYADTARALGQAMAHRQIELVYGGGHVGLMGVVADSVLDAGGRAIGVIPQALVERELAHDRLTELHVTASMHERKALMVGLSDAFVALPGGFGTADEWFEILTWAQLNLHDKPVGLLDVAGFFDPLLTWIDRTVEEGFVKKQHRDKLFVERDIEPLLDRLAAAT
ncbi:MAG TPA: TIGR00730 family Rossman fold protein [Gemmataceae bacterium]|jgi:hypothetical protein|nr:TIGR00730 family Rossman fold protein [Gemmataceae bacterium]